ncbi:MAG: M20/M25/M40 family metallo-hydrolase, partial [Candidatus Parcubacteria bacterium]|nr:M20/M25/M40 family metallo-hydrolase [Candidatus Parcubacteria bacterium]
MKAQQILDKLIQFNTVDDKDNGSIMKYLSDLLSPAGFKIQLVKNKISRKINLLAKYNQSKKTVLTFSGHTDTVPATKAWIQEPFKLTPKNNKLYGLGTGDMKGPIAAFISAVLSFDLKKFKKGLNLVFTYGEEKDLEGIQNLLKKVKLKTNLVIVGEDTGLIPVVASKGAYAVKIEFKGKAAHGAEINKGINAIILAQQFIDKLNQYFITLQTTQNTIFKIPFATLNIAKIMGGDLINRVPDFCLLEFEYRTIKQRQGIKIYEDILQILRLMGCNFKIKLDLQIQP